MRRYRDNEGREEPARSRPERLLDGQGTNEAGGAGVGSMLDAQWTGFVASGRPLTADIESIRPGRTGVPSTAR